VLTHVPNANVDDYLRVVLAVLCYLRLSCPFWKVKQTDNVAFLHHVEEGSLCSLLPVHLQLLGLGWFENTSLSAPSPLSICLSLPLSLLSQRTFVVICLLGTANNSDYEHAHCICVRCSRERETERETEKERERERERRSKKKEG
jgi:hypothetical protein